MIARPDISIANIEELFADDLGQLWSPATVTVTWPPVRGLRAPSLAIKVIAPARADMTIDDLRQAHLQAALDVLSAAVLSLEEPIIMRRPRKRNADPVHARLRTGVGGTKTFRRLAR